MKVDLREILVPRATSLALGGLFATTGMLLSLAGPAWAAPTPVSFATAED
jgi:hypothetical protein